MPNPPSDPDVLDVETLAARLGIAPNTVRKLARTGEVPALRVGKAWRFYWPTVLATMSEQRVHPGVDAGDDQEQPA